MSHRIVINTEIKDKVAIERALNENSWKFEIRGSRLHIQDGPYGGGAVDLKTGRFHGDSDFHSPERLAPLLQAYGEALWMGRFNENNGFLESRSVLQDGTIRLVGEVMVA